MIFAIIVTYNGIDHIESCLKSVYLQDVFIRVVIVDNASTDNTVSYIQANFPDVCVMRLSKNLGFGRANNIGIKYAIDNGAEYLLLLNQDAWLEEKCISQMMRVIPVSEKYLLWSPLHLNGSRDGLDIHFSEFLLQTEPRGQLLSGALVGRLASIYSIPYVNAAIWLFSRKCISKVGYFHPMFSHYGEDMEYCSRIRNMGFSIGIIPSAMSVHNRSQSYFNEPITNKNRLLVKTRAHILFLLTDYQAPLNLKLWRIFKKISFTTIEKSNMLENLYLKFGLFVFAIHKCFTILLKKDYQRHDILYLKHTVDDYKKHLIEICNQYISV